MLHIAKIEPGEGTLFPDDTFPTWFASLDGDYWIEIKGEPTQEHEDQVKEILSGTEDSEGRRMIPMTIATRLIRHWGAQVIT